MINERAILEKILEDLYESYQHYEGNPTMQNSIIRQMITYCNRSWISVVDYISAKSKQEAEMQKAFTFSEQKLVEKQKQNATESQILQPELVAENSEMNGAKKLAKKSKKFSAKSLYTCQICNKSFATIQALNGHRKKHSKST